MSRTASIERVTKETRIKVWIETECWSEKKQAFVMYPGSDKLDASLALAVRFGFDSRKRLLQTLDAIDRELGAGPFHYRYSGMQEEEGCFLACSFRNERFSFMRTTCRLTLNNNNFFFTFSWLFHQT